MNIGSHTIDIEKIHTRFFCSISSSSYMRAKSLAYYITLIINHRIKFHSATKFLTKNSKRFCNITSFFYIYLIAVTFKYCMTNLLYCKHTKYSRSSIVLLIELYLRVCEYKILSAVTKFLKIISLHSLKFFPGLIRVSISFS